jgi:ATP-dependent protease ClpP protease subunit
MIYIPMKVRHEVKALAAGRIFEFYITDDIKPDGERFNWDTYSWEAVESTTCQRYFVDNTKDAQTGDTINLYINSWGGSVKEALGIYNVLRRCGATVVAYIDGVAASAASVIAMAADKVIMPRNTAMMVHNAAWGVYGNSKELRKSADDLDIINGAMLQSYIVKAGDKLPAEKLEELTDGETSVYGHQNHREGHMGRFGTCVRENDHVDHCPIYCKQGRCT